LITLLLVLWRGFSWWDRRAERAHKDARAARYAASMEGMAEALRQHEIKESNRVSQLQGGLAETQEKLRQCCITLEEVARRTRGTLSHAATIRLVQLYYGHVAAAVKQLVARELIDCGHTAHQSRKIRTSMATFLAQVREYVRQAGRSLAVSPDVFFPAYMEPAAPAPGAHQSDVPGDRSLGGERFYLVDLLWEAVSPLFASAGNMRERVDAAELMVDNTITDYFSTIVARYRKDHPEAFGEVDPTQESTGKFSVPKVPHHV
jgi:hypothetical protein